MDFEDRLEQIIRDELRAQRKPIDFDLDALVRVIVAECEEWEDVAGSIVNSISEFSTRSSV